MARILVNRLRGGGVEALSAAVLASHRRLAEYAPTPLRDVAGLAEMLGLEHVWVDVHPGAARTQPNVPSVEPVGSQPDKAPPLQQFDRVIDILSEPWYR